MLDIAYSGATQPVIDLLQTQLEYAEQSRNTAFITTLDENVWLPLHRALKDNASLGSIKLLTRAHPAARYKFQIRMEHILFIYHVNVGFV